jgi:hypothetical protein
MKAIISFTACLSLLPLLTLGQQITSAHVTIGDPSVLMVNGVMPPLELAEIVITALNDPNNTHRVDLYFKGCPVINPLVDWDASIDINAEYPFDLRIYTYHDTSAACPYPPHPILQDSLYLSAAQITIIPEEYGSEAYTLYPNPVTDLLRIKRTDGVMDISIHDTSGRQVMVMAGSLREAAVDVTHLGSGVYFVVMHGHEGRVTERFFKE